MNRFRTRKKAKAEASEHAGEPDVPPVPSITSAFKKSKKGQPEKKVEVDLTSALPSSDDFRTSLLMPNLSARFSMLKEQDDPSSKLGKANDDSVLFPKRASRLNLFGHHQLADISEVSSVHSSSRPSLAMGRTDSYVSGDGYGTDEDSQAGSVMSRSRPGEGNNLFGGRQKVYKIPTGGTRKVSASEESEGTGSDKPVGGGKFIYENDVAFSAFQKYREQEREKQRQLELEISEQLNETTPREEEDVSSPSVANDSRNRTTSSSTTSGPNNRTSTAATSVDSQFHSSVQGPPHLNPPTSNNAAMLPKQNSPFGIDRSQTKTRRLYGQGLEQVAQNQQSSALNRLESLSRQRTDVNDPTALGRSQSRSATSLNERFRGMSPVYASPGFSSATSTPAASPGIRSPDTGHREGSVNSTGSNTGLNVMRPLSPPVSEGEDGGNLAAAVQPEDRGKATALGLFNKPHAKYDEDQFSKLQRQMHEGRNTPPLRRESPAEVPRLAPERSEKPEELPSTTYSSTAEPFKEETPSNELSTTSDIERPPSQPAQGTFFSTTSDSDSEAGETGEDSVQSLKKASPATTQAFDGLHPAFRTSSEADHSDTTADNLESILELPDRTYSESRDLNTIEENEAAETIPSTIEEEPSEKAPDSPTLGPSGLGLSGLVHTHLRRNSDRSSFHPPSSPTLPPKSGEEDQHLRSSIPLPQDYSQAASIHSNPWEYDDIDTTPPDGPNISAMSMKAKQILGQASALSNQDNLNAKKFGGQQLHPETYAHSTGQTEPQSNHQRDGSTETQQERDDFAKELAERRKKVQEKLMNVDSDSRPNSPSVGHRGLDYSPAKPGNAFAMLKKNSSGDSLSGKSDKQSKAIKVLGIDSANMNSSAPNLGQTDIPRSGDQKSLRDNPQHTGPGLPQNRQRGPRQQPAYGGSDDDIRNYSMRESPSQSSFGSWRRDRSSSDVSRRSKTPNRYREDLRSVDEDPHSSHSGDEYRAPRVPASVPSSVPSSARPSVEVNDRHPSDRSASAASERYRSNSRTLTPSYFDNKPSSIQTNNPAMIGLSPRPSPVTPYSANATPPLTEASPPGSGVSTPTLNPNATANSAPRSAGLGTYKKSVDKTQISEPTFISCTSNVPTVGLPAGASLSNGTETPPIPPVNPRRRRQTTTQTIWGAIKGGEKQETPAPMPTPPSDYAEEQSTFSDEGEKRSRSRHKLRKTSSEGGNLNARARQQAMSSSNSPAVPKFPPQVATEGNMF